MVTVSTPPEPTPGSAAAGLAEAVAALLSPLDRELFARAVGKRPIADVVLEAIQAHAVSSDPRQDTSPFFTVFASVLEQMVAAQIHPVVVGRWAAAAHGYVHGIPSMQLAIRPEDVAQLQAFVAARGADAHELPFAVGVSPWRIEFLTGFGDMLTASIPTTPVFTGRARVDVMTLDSLLSQPAALETFEVDLQRLRAGVYKNDDGERGVVAWDFTGRIVGGAAILDPRTAKPCNFVNFRETESLVA
jgi:hypothetical protein